MIVDFMLYVFTTRRRKWQPTIVFLSGVVHGQRNLVGCRTIQYLDTCNFIFFLRFHFTFRVGCIVLCEPYVWFHSVWLIFFLGSPIIHTWMWELDCEESWAPNNWTVLLEKTLESPLDCKEIQPVHPRGDQSWMFIGRTDAEAETPILWPPHGKSWLIGKDPDAGRDWGQEEKGTTEDEMAGWHHRLNWHEFE